MFVQQNPIDPTLPQSMQVEELPSWPLEIGDLLTNLFNPANPPLLAMGMNLWTGLAAIVVVWTGLRIAFAGDSFQPWEFVSLIIGLSIPLGMLRFYAVDVPGVGVPFPFIVPEGADAIAQAFRADMTTEMNLAQAEMNEAMRQNLQAAWAGEDRPGVLRVGAAIMAAVRNFAAFVQTLIGSMTFTVCFLLIGAICLAQVLWAQIALAILIFLGPVMIPWLVFKPMAFLFWGWFRAIWTYSLYSIIAMAVLRIFGAIAITVIETVNQAIIGGGSPTEGPELVPLYLSVIPLVVCAIMAALKVPQLASAIVGGGPSGGGIGGMAAMAMTAGKAKMAKMAAGAVK